jgi:hypothetical protein
MQSTKFKIDYNESTEQPELCFLLNTASEDVLDKLMKRFVELANTTGKKVAAEKIEGDTGTTKILLSIVNI